MLKLIFLLGFFLNISFATQGDYVDMGAGTTKVGEKSLLAINLSNVKDWHTYWKNPGDAGLEIKFKFTVDDKEIKLNDYPWPTPKRYIEQGNMWAYGYSSTYSFFYDLPSELKNKTLKILGTWLVCKDICIPGSKTVEISFDKHLYGQTAPTPSEGELAKTFSKLPKIGDYSDLSIFLTKGDKDNQLALHYILENAELDKLREKSNVITPYLNPPFDYKHEEVYYDSQTKTLFGRFLIDWDGIYEEPVWNLPADGVFKKPLTAKYLLNYPKDQPSTIITHTFDQFTLSGNKELSQKFKTLMIIEGKVSDNQSPESKNESESLILTLLFAFLGGLILNLMPCVLPVISLKLFGLIVHSDESKKQILKHNLAYTAGVLSSFLVLALAVTALKATGEQIGWGFQLQSPLFVFAMILIIFVMALNMFGLFEFITPGGKVLSNTEVKKGMGADFFNGVLATILSTPCSAPFLGTALTFAFTTSILNSFLIFIFVGLGLSFPFILTGIFPGLIRFLPKPGLWMQTLKYFLGLSLLLTAAWLMDVLFGIVEFNLVGIYFLTTLCLIFFTFFAYRFVSKNKALMAILLILTIGLSVTTGKLFNTSVISESTMKSSDSSWEKWTPEKFSSSSNEYIFVNFTAKWCLTCKVNKRLVLNSDDFKELSKDKNIRLMEGDWTKKDDAITSFLAKYKIVGVPAYFIKKPNGDIISLGETISINKVKENL